MKAEMTILSRSNLWRVFFGATSEAFRTQDEQSMNVLEDMIQNYANAGVFFHFFCVFFVFLWGKSNLMKIYVVVLKDFPPKQNSASHTIHGTIVYLPTFGWFLWFSYR